jgi:preprotein translocase subunit SecD
MVEKLIIIGITAIIIAFATVFACLIHDYLRFNIILQIASAFVCAGILTFATMSIIDKL